MAELEKKVKVVALCSKGRFQNYMVNRLYNDHELLGVVFVEQLSALVTPYKRFIHLARYLNPYHFFRYVVARLYLPAVEANAEYQIKKEYPELQKFQRLPDSIDYLTVNDVNDPAVTAFLKRLKPDAVCVNGTNLIRNPLLSLASDFKYGMINLHTGLSPYSRGGNCNLFMLLEGQPQLVGGTVHYIDKGIDSGDILHTYRPLFKDDDPYELIEARVFVEGMKNLSQALTDIANGTALKVKQWHEGKLFLMKTGYKYELYHRFLVNKKIKAGLLSEYVSNKEDIDKGVRLVERD